MISNRQRRRTLAAPLNQKTICALVTTWAPPFRPAPPSTLPTTLARSACRSAAFPPSLRPTPPLATPRLMLSSRAQRGICCLRSDGTLTREVGCPPKQSPWEEHGGNAARFFGVRRLCRRFYAAHIADQPHISATHARRHCPAFRRHPEEIVDQEFGLAGPHLTLDAAERVRASLLLTIRRSGVYSS